MGPRSEYSCVPGCFFSLGKLLCTSEALIHKGLFLISFYSPVQDMHIVLNALTSKQLLYYRKVATIFR